MEYIPYLILTPLAFCFGFQYQNSTVKREVFFNSGWYRFLQLMFSLLLIAQFSIIRALFGYQENWTKMLAVTGTFYLFMITINSVFLRISKRITTLECVFYFLISLALIAYFLFILGEALAATAAHHP